MHHYLTDLARQKRLWHIPIAVMSMIWGIACIAVWLEDSPLGEDFNIWLSSYVFVIGLAVLPLYLIIRRRLCQLNAHIIARALAGQKETELPLWRLDEALGVKNAERKIRTLIRCGFLRHVELDGSNLLLDPPGFAPDAPAETENVEEEEDVLTRIRRLNDAIADAAVSEQIDRLERVTGSILQTVAERPDRRDDARRFMNYYLPVTLKLLESYRLMETQSYQGENIRAGRARIHDVLSKLVTAAERQQDRLFSAEAVDIEAEISVLETMMAADGLSESETSKTPQPLMRGD